MMAMTVMVIMDVLCYYYCDDESGDNDDSDGDYVGDDDDDDHDNDDDGSDDEWNEHHDNYILTIIYLVLGSLHRRCISCSATKLCFQINDPCLSCSFLIKTKHRNFTLEHG